MECGDAMLQEGIKITEKLRFPVSFLYSQIAGASLVLEEEGAGKTTWPLRQGRFPETILFLSTW